MMTVNFPRQLDLHGENETIVYIKINIFLLTFKVKTLNEFYNEI